MHVGVMFVVNPLGSQTVKTFSLEIGSANKAQYEGAQKLLYNDFFPKSEFSSVTYVVLHVARKLHLYTLR